MNTDKKRMLCYDPITCLYFYVYESEIKDLYSKIKEFEYQTTGLGEWIEQLEDEVFIQDQDDSRITRLEKELFPNDELSLYSQVKGLNLKQYYTTDRIEKLEKRINNIDETINSQNIQIIKLKEEIKYLNSAIKLLLIKHESPYSGDHGI